MKRLNLAHPWLIAIFPVIHLAAYNIDQITPSQAIYPLLIALSVATLLFLLSLGAYSDARKAALAASTAVVLLATYGRAVEKLFDKEWMPSASVNYVIGGLWIVLALAAFALLYRLKRDLGGITRFVTLATLALLAMSAFKVARAYDFSGGGQGSDIVPRKVPIVTEDRQDLPDVYYIILDGYARNDVLMGEYGYDNSDFTGFLKGNGFFVAEKSWSNYPETFLSLPSTLNMKYLDDEIREIVAKKGEKSNDRASFYAMIQDNVVAGAFRSKGYQYVTVLTNWTGTEKSKSADIAFDHVPLLRSEFISVLVRTTAFRVFAPSVAELHRFSLDAIKKIPEIKGPTFAFIHILMPHNPYVFDRNGNERKFISQSLQFKEKTGGWKDKEAYVDQLIFLNGQVKGIVDELLAKSPNKPIIVIQSDHGSASTAVDAEGPKPAERLAILNAVYAGPQITSRLTQTMTPVNTFRILLSELFGDDLPLLPERHYFSWYKAPLRMREVTEEIAAGTPSAK